jgi:3-oxoadipate enol-lactonase
VTRQGHVEVDGAKLYYEDDGAGEPVLLIHGNILDRRMWEPQVGVFALRYRVIRMDVRGFGRSEYDPGPYSDHGDVLGLVRSLGLDEVHVVGLSMGGNIALEFALVHPEATKSLVVVPGGIAGHELPLIPRSIVTIQLAYFPCATIGILP